MSEPTEQSFTEIVLTNTTTAQRKLLLELFQKEARGDKLRQSQSDLLYRLRQPERLMKRITNPEQRFRMSQRANDFLKALPNEPRYRKLLYADTDLESRSQLFLDLLMRWERQEKLRQTTLEHAISLEARLARERVRASDDARADAERVLLIERELKRKRRAAADKAAGHSMPSLRSFPDVRETLSKAAEELRDQQANGTYRRRRLHESRRGPRKPVPKK